ncbi:MAG: fibronectin type III domain-containing protein [Myxococcales bacterium]
MPRVYVTLSNEPTTVAALILFVRAIIAAMTNNSWFSNPNPPLATVSADVDALEAAEKIAKTRAAGAVDARNTARDKVEYDLEQLRQYVQLVADANPKDAHAIIHSALLTERQASTYHKPEFEATTGETPGSALLRARAIAGAIAYFWQFSLDNVLWHDMPETAQANTSVTNLTPNTTYFFRFRVLTRSGKGEFGQSVTLHLD